jgi:hypothetical protein
MQRISFLVITVLIVLGSYLASLVQEKISPADASKYLGKRAAVFSFLLSV